MREAAELGDALHEALGLEASYERTCHDLWIA
jgi:hypothetical protein